jgi:hypothetical protein
MSSGNNRRSLEEDFKPSLQPAETLSRRPMTQAPDTWKLKGNKMCMALRCCVCGVLLPMTENE